MGLPVRIVLYAGDTRSGDAAARAAFDRVAALDQMMSDYRPDSELRRLEGRPGEWVPVSTDLFNVLERAVDMARATDGAFDPTIGPLVALWREARKTGRLPDAATLAAAKARVGWRRIELESRSVVTSNGDARPLAGRDAGPTGGASPPKLQELEERQGASPPKLQEIEERRWVRLQPLTQLDLGGIAKGYILQEALRTLRAHRVESALVEAGGDIVVGAPPPGRSGWRIEVPGAGESFRERAAHLSNAALATSGPAAQFVEIAGVRYSHVIDPVTGLGLTRDLTAHVIADDAATADALATALTVIGPGRAAQIGAQFAGAIVSVR